MMVLRMALKPYMEDGSWDQLPVPSLQESPVPTIRTTTHAKARCDDMVVPVDVATAGIASRSRGRVTTGFTGVRN